MAKPLVSIIIPIAPHHLERSVIAVQSAHAQSFPSIQVLTVIDHEQRGAGWARNEGARQAWGDFLVFLDADDTLHPDFVAATVLHYQTATYVHTAWTEGDKVCKDSVGKPHLVTTLYPTACFRALGGFDESLPGAEDIDFYWKSRANGICGILLDQPLVHYSEGGRRSIEFDAHPDADAIRRMISERYGGNLMGCCGGEGQPAVLNPGDQQPGDVLAVIMWNGYSNETSHFNNTRRYKGAGGQRIYVYAQDVETMKMSSGLPMFQPVLDAKTLAPERSEVLKLAGLT